MLLMDEPFGALDEIVRDHLNVQLLKLWARTNKTIVFVTHSIPEAVYLSTRIVVMSPRPGRIHEIIDCDLGQDRPLDIREDPRFLEIAHRVREGLAAGHGQTERRDAGRIDRRVSRKRIERGGQIIEHPTEQGTSTPQRRLGERAFGAFGLPRAEAGHDRPPRAAQADRPAS